MNLFHASDADLIEVSQWVSSRSECKIWAGPLVSYPVSINKFKQEIGFNPSNSYVYKTNKELLAFGQVINTDKYAHLARIITNPRKRGIGLGRKICENLLNKASDLNKDGISLKVYRNNNTAINLYISLGFQEQLEKSNNEELFMVKTQQER